MSELTRLFIKLVKIDSPSGQESNIRNYLVQLLVGLGFNTKIDTVGNVYACSSAKPQAIFVCHMDTVEPGRGITPKYQRGQIHSDGKTILGADNKAALSALLCALKKYKQTKHELPPIELIFSIKEETGGGIEHFLLEWIKSKKGYIFDFAAPIGGIVLSSPYIYNFTCNFAGLASHSSRPDKGINALTPAAKFISSVQVGGLDDGHTTINIGSVHSGVGINTVPAECLIKGEVRSTDIELFKHHLQVIKELAKASVIGTDVHVRFELDGYCPGYIYQPNDPVIVGIASQIERLGLVATYLKSTGVSDANSLVGMGIRVINLADGVQHPHTTKETIKVSDLKTLSELMSSLMGDS